MLLYVVSPNFRSRTFVILARETDTVARVRAQILHYLYEMGLENFHFKLRYRDQYLRDAYNIEDYNILPNSVVVMIPLVKQCDSTSDIRSTSSQQTRRSDPAGNEQHSQIKQAMEEEIDIFKLRENLVEVFRAFIWLHLIFSFLSVFTTYWYSVFWYLALFLFSVMYCPNYCRTTGFTGVWSIYKERFCIVYIVCGLLVFFGDVVMEFFELRKPVIYGCSAATYGSNCSVTVIFSSVFFMLHAVYMASMAGLCAGMLHNFKVEVGDFMERYLVQTRDIVRLLETARSGRGKDRRMAAFELASMAAAGDDNKFRIVAEGGLTVLISLALSADAATQEHAVEALVELLAIPAIQTEFAAEDGLRALTALLRAPNAPKLRRDAATAVARVVQESPELQLAVVEARGLDDLCFGAESSAADTQRLLAGVFLELAFNQSVKTVFLERSEIVLSAVMALNLSEDVETQRLALQTLELIALDNADCLFMKDGLLEVLLDTPWRSMETNMYVLAGKIILYFSETVDGADRMLRYPRIREALDRFSLPKDLTLQKLVIRLVGSLAESSPGNRAAVRDLQMGDILTRIRTEAVDVEISELADQGIQLLNSDDTSASTKDKRPFSSSTKLGSSLNAEMANRIAQMRLESGSRASLRSSVSAGTSVSAKKKKN